MAPIGCVGYQLSVAFLVAVRFTLSLGHSATDTFAKFLQAYRGSALSRVEEFSWFKALREEKGSV